ncbi:hypothetical protein H0H93_012261 [Arthromyces matolae]|nr:hypothetical protein H0H93_012261 [Arthromyces matolae]
MADHCSNFARSLGVEHITKKIHWQVRPQPGAPFETHARTKRYQMLFDAMSEKKIGTVAFGHHLDDQVETSLLRLSWGSTNLGAAGMRPCRRWGMGRIVNGHVEYGLEGMNRWIVRPMLNVSKGRILATCEANNLEYVTDPTNFQPAITLRNAIRYEIQANIDRNRHAPSSIFPEEIVKRLMMLETTGKALPDTPLSLGSSIDELKDAVRVLSQQAQDIDDGVDSALRSCSLPTFPGTFLFSKMALDQIRNPDIQRALVYRVLRYVSPYPWGSLNADAGRRRDSISQIIAALWAPVKTNSRIPSFTAGGNVLWKPAIFRGSAIKLPPHLIAKDLLQDDMVGWLATRLPPPKPENFKAGGFPHTLEVDITKSIVDAYRNWRDGGPSTASVLYDARFSVTFDFDKAAPGLFTDMLQDHSKNRLLLLPNTGWFWPRVVFESRGFQETLHEAIYEESSTSVIPIPRRKLRSSELKLIDSGWITTRWVRPLSAI